MTGSGITKKLHHFVPQAYLRGFANEKERLTAVRLPGDQSFTTIVKNVAAQTHFHRVKGLDKPDEFEDVLGSIEGEAQSVIRKLETRDAPPLKEGDRAVLAFFIALQAVRGPETRRTSEVMEASFIRMQVGAGGRKNVKAWALKHLGFDPTDAQAERIWSEATQPGGPPIKLSNLTHIKYMLETAEQLMTYVLSRPWVFYYFARRSLVTSDSPLGLVQNPEDEPHMGVGFGTAKFITFPLTRRLGLLMTDPMKQIESWEPGDERIQTWANAVRRGKADLIEAGNTEIERFFNDTTVANASQYVFHHPDDGRFLPNQLPEPTLVTMRMSGLNDAEWDGTPMFGDHESM